MFDGGQWILDDVLDVQIGPYLVQVRAKVVELGVGQHDELHARGGLVVVQLVFAGAVGEEGVVLAAQLLHHVAEREDQAEDQLLVVGVLGALGGGLVAMGGVEGGGGRGRAWLLGGGGGGALGSPAARVDALGWSSVSVWSMATGGCGWWADSLWRSKM